MITIFCYLVVILVEFLQQNPLTNGVLNVSRIVKHYKCEFLSQMRCVLGGILFH